MHKDEIKGAAKQATRVQTKALAALHRWMAQYVKIARVALRNDPALLKSLGITSQVSRIAAQRSLAQEAHTQTT